MVEIKNLTKKYGSVTVLDNFELSLQDNSKTVLMGDSGRGKTTLLRIISGLEKADEGTIRIDGNMAYMFQEPRLLPWKSTLDNVKAFLPKEHHALAEKYHGGGHACAAGSTVYSKKEADALIEDADSLVRDYKQNNGGWL